jgi:hypothetical protein
MRVYSSSTKVSHAIHFSSHFSRLPDDGKLVRELSMAKAKERTAAERMASPARRIVGRAGRPQIHTLLSDILRVRDTGAQSPGSTLFYKVRTCQWEELAIFHTVGKTAPQDPF